LKRIDIKQKEGSHVEEIMKINSDLFKGGILEIKKGLLLFLAALNFDLK
jgi:hypothetical protein